MEDKMKPYLSFILIVCVCNSVSVISASVPVLIWGHHGVRDVPSSPVGHTIPSDTFHKVLNDLTQNVEHNLLLFVQDQLSLDDISQNANVYSSESDGAAYQHLKSLMLKTPSTHLPRVESPMDAVDTLREKFSGRVHDIKAPYTLNDLKLTDDGSLILVHLPDVASTQNDRQETVRNIDEIIGSVSSDMERTGKPYTAIYTASQSSKDSVTYVNTGRHLLAAEDMADGAHLYEVGSCILFYSTNMTLKLSTSDKNPNNTWVLPVTKDTTGSKCGPQDNEPFLMLHFTVEGLSKLDISLQFNKTWDGYWVVSTWSVEYQVSGDNNKTTVMLPSKEVYGPLKFSYHCTKPALSLKDLSLDVADFQVQAFNVTSATGFGFPNDCVGFFTIPIWSGIISTLVLLSVLGFGIMMLANINTMDRFDDPKGKTITINTGE